MGISTNWQEITMESESFSRIREKFNLLLQKLFQKMEQNHSDEGSINMKVDVLMAKSFIPDEDGNSREVHKPVLKYKINTQVPVRDGFDGKNDTEMELVFDEELQRFVLKYVSEGGQQSFFDPEYAEFMNTVDAEATVVDDKPALPMKQPLLETSEEEPTEREECVSDGEKPSDDEIMGQEDTNGADGGTESSEDNPYPYDE